MEREQLSDALCRSADRIDEAVWAALSRLHAATSSPTTEIHLSYSCRDLRQFRATYASWVMLRAFREATGKPDASFQDLHAHLGEPVSAVPAPNAIALGQGRWWLRGATRSGSAAGAGAVLNAFPALARGRTAADARASADFTEFDGYVTGAVRRAVSGVFDDAT